ncbi:hypothetical protein NEUTE1DRAFT_109559 [Neurospora tetrasperma FGSC 2508]|uniref:Protein kinase domain-containing protein n=1 Tax=Neurospora tetrasperma (strain FGSC 2508 / ATCC MYA-4615 / P0657) TaxID=510951 RepID=F8MJP1_NEUT8|nr:uncharacterized protein NEUTE1DRAFT_109559 [Neurospora tetrasperma FGSC 2508]EGO57282.1 hypothetical protein NEUTE1DRAFT_109559 [Neurospora tetrasperma FGSC 2508]EGZ72467.1 hypothetical protein NEUTE2DRAFT_139457 [Neurospora tetrasperma FGSC 2509]
MSTTASTLPPAQKKPINNMESQNDANNSPFSKPASKPSTASSIAVSDTPQGYEFELWPASAIEDPNQYRRGGHHPILLGDHLGPSTNPSRFRVFHKLGYGSFGTIWLYQDINEIRNNKRWKWRVVKVMSAKASNLKGGNANLKVMEMFEGINRDLLKIKGVSIPMETGPGDDGASQSEEQLLAVLSEPERAAVVIWDDAQEPQPVTGNPSVPEYLVGCGDIAYGSGLVSIKIAVVDYGVAYPSSDHPELIGVKADIWSLATAIFEIRFGFPPFGTNNHAPSSIPNMEESMGPMPPPFRTTVREWYKLPAETDKELQGKSNSELSYVTANPEELEKNRKFHLEERGAKDPIIFRILYPRSTNISPAQAEDIANQAKSNPAQLPLWTPIPRNPDRLAYYTRKDYLKLVPPKEEVEQPKDRATIEQIMEHPWFEGRKERKVTVIRPTITTSESGIVGSISTKLGQVKANINSWLNILFWDKEKKKTIGSNILSRYVWQPTSKTFGKISRVPTAIFWLLIIIPAAWVIKRRIDRGRNVFSPSSVRGLRH